MPYGFSPVSDGLEFHLIVVAIGTNISAAIRTGGMEAELSMSPGSNIAAPSVAAFTFPFKPP